MGKSDHYFTFPLAVLNGEDFDSAGSAPVATPLNCLELAVNCGMLGAGKGYRHNHGDEAFRVRLEEACEKLKIGTTSRPRPYTANAELLVGAELCNVTLGSHKSDYIERQVKHAENAPRGGPLVRMSSNTLWAAVYQARAESGRDTQLPERGISWREFRILAAILSVKTNRAGFAFIGWETIQARACGFTTKEAFHNADRIPDHLAPPLTHKQIRSTCDTLENLGFFARFRLSSGKRGGLMAYSFRHDRDSLGDVVCEFVNFRDQVGISENRAADAVKCLKLLKRAKSGQSEVKGGGKAEGKSKGKHNEKSNGEKSHSKNPNATGGSPGLVVDDEFANGNQNDEDVPSSDIGTEEDDEW